MRRSISLLLALALFCGVASAHAGPDDPGTYRVAFIRPGAGGYIHGVTRVAAVGTKVLVGSPDEFSRADVYDGRTGKLLHHFPPFYGLNETSFGEAVAASRRGYLIGDPQPNEAYLFDRRFRLRLTLRPPAGASHGSFGGAIGAMHRTIVVGDRVAGGSMPGIPGPGAVHLFNDRTGAFLRTVVSPAPAANTGFGAAVVGCAGGFAVAQPGDYYHAGAVHIFDRDGDWVQTLQAPAPHPRDDYGTALAASGTRLLVGYPDRFASKGFALLYERRGGQFRLIRTFTAADDLVSNGLAVAINRDHVVVGGHEALTVFDADAGTRLATLRIPIPEDPFDYQPTMPWWGLGVSVAIVGKTIVAGTAGDDENAGSVAIGFAPNAPTPPECEATYPCY